MLPLVSFGTRSGSLRQTVLPLDCFFSTITSTNTNSLLLPSSNYALLQLISGHCALNNHQYRFGFSLTPACRCGKTNETTTHFLFECSLFDNQRFNLKESVEANNVCWPPPLSAFPASAKLWNSLIAYIAATKRLAVRRPVQPLPLVRPRGSV